MGFEDVEEETEDQQFELNATDTSEDYTGDQSDDIDITQARAQLLKATKFRTVSHLTVSLPSVLHAHTRQMHIHIDE